MLLVSPAGSGKSVIIAEVARLAALKGGRVLFMVHRRELVDQIKKSFAENQVRMSQCTIMTVGKIKNRLDSLPRPNLIITDETHHGLAKTYRTIYKHYKDVPRLGFTASPWRMSGQGLGEIYDTMIEGPTVSWLIEHHYLAPYSYYSVKLIDESKLSKSSTGDYTSKSIDDAVGKTIFGDVIGTYRAKTPGQKAIVYAHNVKFSKQVAKEFNAAGITAKHADAKTPTLEREQIMSDFKTGKIKVLCNCDLISEGYDVPDCSVVIMLRPTRSLVLDIQQSMRCMRYQPGKQATIIDHVANYTRFGLPDTPRTWTLKGRKKHSKQTTVPIQTCPNCYAVIAAGRTVCPICGHTIETEQQAELEVDKKARVEKINSKKFNLTVDYSVVKYGRMQPAEATSYRDLQGIAKARHYKPGWAYYQAKNRGFIRAKK